MNLEAVVGHKGTFSAEACLTGLGEEDGKVQVQ